MSGMMLSGWVSFLRECGSRSLSGTHPESSSQVRYRMRWRLLPVVGLVAALGFMGVLTMPVTALPPTLDTTTSNTQTVQLGSDSLISSLPAQSSAPHQVVSLDTAQVYVPAGNLLMGSAGNPEAYPNETPQHQVYLDAYWIDQTEVTNAMYTGCVAASSCTAPQSTSRPPATATTATRCTPTTR